VWHRNRSQIATRVPNSDMLFRGCSEAIFRFVGTFVECYVAVTERPTMATRMATNTSISHLSRRISPRRSPALSTLN
jgi:hypothetical protein